MIWEKLNFVAVNFSEPQRKYFSWLLIYSKKCISWYISFMSATFRIIWINDPDPTAQIRTTPFEIFLMLGQSCDVRTMRGVSRTLSYLCSGCNITEFCFVVCLSYRKWIAAIKAFVSHHTTMCKTSRNLSISIVSNAETAMWMTTNINNDRKI